MHFGSDLFSDIFARRDDACTRLDPRLKTIWALMIIGCVVLSGNAVFPSVVLGVCLVAIFAVKIPFPLVARRLASPLGIVSTLIVVQSVLTAGTPLWRIDLSIVTVTFTREGLHLGLLIGVRVLSAVSVVLLLSFVTPAHQIFRSMRWLRVPRGWVEIGILMYRYLFTLLDLVSDMTAAQRLRLGYRGLRRSLCSASVVAGTVILRSVDQAVRSHEAMILRGYRGMLPLEPMPALARKERWTLAAAGLLIVGLHLLCQRSFA